MCHAAARSFVRRPHVAPKPGVLARRRGDHRTGDRREHGDLQRHQRRPVAAAPVHGSGSTRRHVHGSAGTQQRRDAVLQRELRRYPQRLDGCVRRHGCRADCPSGHARRGRRAGTDPAGVGDDELFQTDGRADRVRPRLRRRRRPSAAAGRCRGARYTGAAAGGGDSQPCVLGAALRRRSEGAGPAHSRRSASGDRWRARARARADVPAWRQRRAASRLLGGQSSELRQREPQYLRPAADRPAEAGRDAGTGAGSGGIGRDEASAGLSAAGHRRVLRAAGADARHPGRRGPAGDSRADGRRHFSPADRLRQRREPAAGPGVGP